MSCGDYKELISAWLDGEIDKSEEKILSSHLEECDECRRYAEEMKKVAGFGRSFHTLEMPYQTEKKILDKTIESRFSNQSIFDKFKGYYRVPRGLVWAAMLAVLFLIGDAVLEPYQPEEPIAVVRIESISNEELIQKVVFTEDDIISTSTMIKKSDDIKGE